MPDFLQVTYDLNDPAMASVAECFRAAKPGARLVLTTNPMGHLSEFYAVFREVLRQLQKLSSLERLQVQEAHRGTKDSLGDLLQAAGFRVVRIREDQFSPNAVTLRTRRTELTLERIAFYAAAKKRAQSHAGRSGLDRRPLGSRAGGFERRGQPASHRTVAHGPRAERGRGRVRISAGGGWAARRQRAG